MGPVLVQFKWWGCRLYSPGGSWRRLRRRPYQEVNGWLIGFDVEMASGLVMRLNTLQHDGLGKKYTGLKAKVLT